jgi:hypothetical protein
MLAELPERNADNVSRTASYLELYAWTRDNPPELPWLLMAHLVSRNGGYLMTDTAVFLDRKEGLFRESAMVELFLFLERANFLIFYDAWYHVLHHLLLRREQMNAGRVTRYMRERWAEYERDGAAGVSAELERRLVHELVVNEQNFIEHRVVHHAGFAVAAAMVGFFETIERDAPLVFPVDAPPIKVGTFANLERRIQTGRDIFDEVLRDREKRRRCFEWATAHPHTGSRAIYGGRPTPSVHDAWPLARVRALGPEVHDPPELFPGEL